MKVAGAKIFVDAWIILVKQETRAIEVVPPQLAVR